MKKFAFALILLLSLLALSCASAATYTFSDIYAEVELSDDYIVLTPDNLDHHPEWLARQEKDAEALKADYLQRGVLLQAWSTEGDVCVEISAVQDELAKSLFDVDQQSTNTRKSYRLGHTGGTLYPELGYDFTSAEWSNVKARGRFLMMKYNYDANDQKGYLRRTVRNGYTVSVDYRVFGRSIKSSDSKAIDKIMASWKFTTVLDKPADAVPNLMFESKPPAETYTGKFTVSGTGEPGLEIIGVLMRMSSPEPITVTETVNKSGEFSMTVQLPQEGVWLMTLTVLNGDVITEEVFFDTTTYQKSLIPINLDAPIPENLTGNTLTISGTTAKQTTVQCIVEGADSYTKQVKTNNSGRFSFKVPTSAEGDYVITLSFQKKNYNPRRIQYTASRAKTESEQRQDVRDAAVKPAYSTLTDKIKGYTGRTMGYNLYVKSVEQSGDEWISFMAMRKTNSGAYRDIVVVFSEEKPAFTVDSQVKVYLTCTGEYEVQGADDSDMYPCFDLLFID